MNLNMVVGGKEDPMLDIYPLSTTQALFKISVRKKHHEQCELFFSFVYPRNANVSHDAFCYHHEKWKVFL
jgi:hypothetical protein